MQKVTVTAVDCIGVDYIGELDGGSYHAAADMFKDDVDPSELLEPVHGDIELLIGDNQASIFPRTVKTRENLVLAETNFGFILHGSHETFFAANSHEPSVMLSELLNRKISAVLLQSTSSVAVSHAERPKGEVSTDKARSNGSVQQVAENGGQSVLSIKTSAETVFDRMCEVEDGPVCHRCDAVGINSEEERRVQTYKSCLTYDPERKIFVCMLQWKESFRTLSDNRPVALKRLNSLTRTMSRNKALKNWYVDEFEKLINDGYMTEVTAEEDAQWKSNGGIVYYICHFAHFNEHSSSTPLRIIFDASVPFKGKAINSLWEPPPNLIPPILTLLLRFQERKIPVAMDISKAYFTVRLETEESHLHRLLWNQLDKEEEVKTLQLLRNSWETTPAGGICSVAMLIIAEKFKDKYPQVYEFIKSNLYVDDGTTSVDDVSTALQLAKELNIVLSEASFIIKHFMIGGSDSDIDAHIKKCPDVPDNVQRTPEQERILEKGGIRSEEDISLENFDDAFPDTFSRRNYLQIIATTYDPTGLATPVTICLKHELGQIFRLKQEWDDPILDGNDDLPTTRSRCKEVIRSIYGLKEVRFVRCLTPETAVDKPTLVIFCDSSQTAYGCVAYYNWKLENGERASVLAMSKAKPWPQIPTLTIPRGELLGCLLGARIQQTIVKKSSFIFERVMLLTDSTIVLGQLRHEPYKYNMWTASRIGEIQTLTDIRD
ncbi:uncharacterized protein [Macrobrachium rosenbergii]|uniref:uncharacterized protein n=1 Tax=Macrobrachium rosenbergii TaxID=79674 RepID=UPI0034D52185